MSLESLLSGDTMTVRQATTTKDTSGAPQETYADLYTGVACRWEDASAAIRDEYMARGLGVTHTVFTQQTGIAAKHLVIASDGRIAKVEGVRKRRAIGSLPDYFLVDAGEYRPGA